MTTAIALILVFLMPTLDVNWKNNPNINSIREVVEVKMSDPGEEFQTCLQSANQAQLRYEIVFCAKQTDKCSREIVQTYFVSYDSLNNSYHLEEDRHRDELMPKAREFDDYTALLSTILSVNNLQRSQYTSADSEETYLKVRALSKCKGLYGSFYEDFIRYLTFGSYRLSGFDTGWIRFE